MKKTKLLILITILFIVVGIAAVTTNLIVNVSTPISANTDDFDVYFSDVYVDGTQDLSLVNNTRELVFKYKLSAVGDKKTINYDITNASKNYDAKVSITCTASNTYLKVLNSFDEKNDLQARSTKTGALTIELINAVSEEVSYEVKCTINATAVEKESIANTDVPNPLERVFKKGEEISIGNEVFNVISTTDTHVNLLAQFNLSPEYKQSETTNYVTFANTNGWVYTPGPQEINIQEHEGNAKNYVNSYVSYIQSLTKESSISGNLITLEELKSLECTIQDDYSFVSGLTCANSQYSNWLVNNQYWWTRSANSAIDFVVWRVDATGVLNGQDYSGKRGIRPVISIPKSYFQKNIIFFTIDDQTYTAISGMTWIEWINSDFNTSSFTYNPNSSEGAIITVYRTEGSFGYSINQVSANNYIVANKAYTTSKELL